MLAVEVKINGINYELIPKGKVATVIKGHYSGEVVIPETVEYNGTVCNVTSIGRWAFEYCSGLTSVTIPNSVTSIGERAFYDCSGLTSVTIGNSVTSIGDRAFIGCSALTSVTIPNSVKSIGDDAFFGCSHLEKIELNCKNIGGWFSDIESIKEIIIGNSVTSIGENAFYKCDGLTSVSIGNGVTSIGENAFDGCSGLTSVHISDIAAWCNIDFDNLLSNPLYYAHHLYLNGEEVKDLVIPSSVTSIADYAFYYCSGLTSVTIPNSVKSIGERAFRGCRGLTSVTIGNSVTSIGEWAFYECSRLTSVTIPNSVKSIGDDAFYNCSRLTSVTIGSGVTSIYGNAFANCPELLDVYCYAENVPSADSYAFYGSYPEYITLHVPDASIYSYKTTSPWSGFGKIVALTDEETGIDELKGENGTECSAVYDLSGRRVQKAQKGIFIQNGKVMVK